MAVATPGAPHRLKRFLTVWMENEEGWSFEDALQYWREVREEAENDYDRKVCDRQIYRLFAARDGEVLDPVLHQWSLWHGRCPSSWEELIDSGFLRETPVDYFGHQYQILPDSCTTMGLDSVKLD